MTPIPAPGAAVQAACDACGLRSHELDAVVRHADHVALDLDSVEARQLRSHLFALLVGLGWSGTAGNE
jgi:hypothetical protein